jgi:hypothetical protein
MHRCDCLMPKAESGGSRLREATPPRAAHASTPILKLMFTLPP